MELGKGMVLAQVQPILKAHIIGIFISTIILIKYNTKFLHSNAILKCIIKLIIMKVINNIIINKIKFIKTITKLVILMKVLIICLGLAHSLKI